MPTINFEKELNAEQLKVIHEGDGPCLVLAGAGSGKTRTIVYRMAYLLEKGIPPEQILLLTFTNKAAREMLTRVEELTGVNPRRLCGGTFHSAANRFLREFAGLLCLPSEASGVGGGFARGFGILDEEDAKSLIKLAVKEGGFDTGAKKFPSPAIIKSVSSFALNSQILLEDALEMKQPAFYDLAEDIKRIIGIYERKKRESNMMDFDDLLFLLVKLLRENPVVRASLSGRFAYILIDEYQDTNPLQAEMIRLLSPKSGNILVVGDDAQSIYSFRGAAIANILNFPKVYSGAKVFRLEINYRSTPEILNLANDIISKNTAQFPKNLKSVKDSFVKPFMHQAGTGADEARFVVDKIAALRREGVPAKSIAVLFRATHHSQPVELELGRRGIQFEYRGGTRFFERSHIKDALAYLRAFANPSDETAWQRILLMHGGIGPASAQKIFIEIRELQSFEHIANHNFGFALGEKIKFGWNKLIGTIKNLIPHKEKNPSELIRALANSDYAVYLATEYENSKDRLEDIGQLAAFAANYPTLEDFLSEIALYDGFTGRGQTGDAIVLSTIHQAKGLEWDTVFIINLADMAFPNQRALFEDGGVEEERRLFYVAATRAEKKLFLTFPLIGPQGDYVQPSMFLSELDDDLLESAAKKYQENSEYIDEDVPFSDTPPEKRPQEKDWRKRSFLRSVDEL